MISTEIPGAAPTAKRGVEFFLVHGSLAPLRQAIIQPRVNHWEAAAANVGTEFFGAGFHGVVRCLNTALNLASVIILSQSHKAVDSQITRFITCVYLACCGLKVASSACISSRLDSSFSNSVFMLSFVSGASLLWNFDYLAHVTTLILNKRFPHQRPQFIQRARLGSRRLAVAVGGAGFAKVGVKKSQVANQLHQ